MRNDQVTFVGFLVMVSPVGVIAKNTEEDSSDKGEAEEGEDASDDKNEELEGEAKSVAPAGEDNSGAPAGDAERVADAESELATPKAMPKPKEKKRKKSKSGELVAPTPPCAIFRTLRTIKPVEDMSSEYENIDMPADIKTTTARITTFCTAAQSLGKSFRDAIKELKKALSGHTKAVEQSKAEQEKKRKAALGESKARKKRKGADIMESIATLGEPIAQFEYVDSDTVPQNALEWLKDIHTTEIQCAKPYVVTKVAYFVFVFDTEKIKQTYNNQNDKGCLGARVLGARGLLRRRKLDRVHERFPEEPHAGIGLQGYAPER